MNKLLLTAPLIFVLTTSHSFARFISSDTWSGNEQSPLTLHKYLYANADPVNNIDPSGHSAFSLQSFGAVSSIQSTLLAASTSAFAFSLAAVGTTPDLANIENRKWSLWDIYAATKFKSEVSNVAISSSGMTTKERSPNDGHHTIPIYLCGSQAQRLSYINRKKHAALHTGLAGVEVALKVAERGADKLIPFSRRRSQQIIGLADTQTGRAVIANAIGSFYQIGGWSGQGSPSISTVFPNERSQFISGKTSLPECKR